MTTAEATVASLIAHGIDTMYALPGVHNDHLFDAFFKASDAIRVVHSRHEQGAAYMALGAALATNKPQAYAVVPGPGLLNTSAALLTAYSMNAPVLALIGQIPDADIGRGLGHLHEIRDQAGIITRLVDFADRIRGPDAASGLVAQAMRSMGAGRPGPAALECAIDVWGRTGSVTAVPPSPAADIAIDEDAVAAAAKRLGTAKRPVIVCGGGAQSAAGEITQLSAMLQAPVLGYRRGRGVLDSRDPLSVTLPLGHELWGQADVVLAVGTRLLIQLRQWGIDENLAVIRIDADPKEPARLHKPDVALVGDAQPILRRLVDSIGAYNIHRAARTDEMQERQSAWTKRLSKLGPQLGYLAAIRAELPEDGILVDEVTSRICGAPGLSGLPPAHVSFARLSGQPWLGLCDRAWGTRRAPRRARGRNQRGRRFSLHRKRNGNRRAPSHSAHRRGVCGRRVRERDQDPAGTVRQPVDRMRSRQSGLRALCRELRRRRRARTQPRRTARCAAPCNKTS